MKVLVTGACGFLGRNLVTYIKKHAAEVELYTADCIDNCTDYTQNFFQIDFTQEKQVWSMIETIKPDCVIHLAGLFGSNEPMMIYHANVTTLLVLLESLRRMSPSAIVLTAGSAAEYGDISANQLPVSENTPCRPVGMYGQTKYFATQMIEFYHRVYGLTGMVFRPFQLLGKGISSKLAPGAFADQVLSAASKKEIVIKVGNLKSYRDFLDVEDAVRAIWLLCQQPVPGKIFNICSGKATQMEELLDLMIKEVGVKVQIEIDDAKLKGNEDISIVYGSYARIQEHCNWKPTLPLMKSIQAMMRDSAYLK